MSSEERSWRLLGVPIDCVASPGGTELAPDALRAAGLIDSARLRDLGDSRSRLRTPQRDPASGVIAYDDVVGVTKELRQRVATLFDGDDDPLLIIGGCCTVVPGILGGLRDRSPAAGLIYLDGHLDLYDGVNSPTGEAADMPLAVILGKGPTRWMEAAGVHAQLTPADVHLLGPRDHAEAQSLGSLLPGDFPGLHYCDAVGVSGGDPGALARATVSAIAAHNPGGFWVHLDLDVLDEIAFPATDYLSPGGLDRETTKALLAPLTGHSSCRGLSVACYNPEKDPGGEAADFLTQLLGEVLR